MNAIHALQSDKVEEKLTVLDHWIQMSIPLAFTRTKGSDTYTNARAAMAGDRMKDHHDVTVSESSHPLPLEILMVLQDDNTECGIFFEEFIIKMQASLSCFFFVLRIV